MGPIPLHFFNWVVLTHPFDIIVTQGNHTVTQSTFPVPCVPAHQTNITINGFDSRFRDTSNGTAITILSVPIVPENVNLTMWFFDYNTCGEGGVGVINNNETSDETLEGFVVSSPSFILLRSINHRPIAHCTLRFVSALLSYQ